MRKAESGTARAILFAAVVSAAAPGIHAQSSAPRERDWWQDVPPDARILNNCVQWAMKESKNTPEQNNARMCAGVGFLTGRGLPEGPNIPLAEYWLALARDNGVKGAREIFALAEALKPDANGEVAALRMREAIEKDGLGGSRRPSASKPCEGEGYCAMYMRFVVAYFKTFVRYPMAARVNDEEASITVLIDVRTRTVTFKEKSVPPKFAKAVQDTLKGALAALPLPKEWDMKNFGVVEFPVNFKLSD
jgi:hypothetical protein